MLLTMDNSEENDVINFPIQIKMMGEPMSDKELVLKTRFHALNLLNKAELGVFTLTDENKKSIKFYNENCHLVGLELLDVDF